MIHTYAPFGLQVLEIVWINLLLSGDNAVLIALACRSLPEGQQRLGMILGAAAAVVLRILFSLVTAELSQIPYLRLIGGMLLLWIAVRLVTGGASRHKVAPSRSLWGAVVTVALADAVMSFDNVLAIAMAAKNSVPLIVFGLLVSIPLVVWGSTVVLKIVDRFPLLTWGARRSSAGSPATSSATTRPWSAGSDRAPICSNSWAPIGFAALTLAGAWLTIKQARGRLDPT